MRRHLIDNPSMSSEEQPWEPWQLLKLVKLSGSCSLTDSKDVGLNFLTEMVPLTNWFMTNFNTLPILATTCRCLMVMANVSYDFLLVWLLVSPYFGILRFIPNFLNLWANMIRLSHHCATLEAQVSKLQVDI